MADSKEERLDRAVMKKLVLGIVGGLLLAVGLLAQWGWENMTKLAALEAKTTVMQQQVQVCGKITAKATELIAALNTEE